MRLGLLMCLYPFLLTISLHLTIARAAQLPPLAELQAEYDRFNQNMGAQPRPLLFRTTRADEAYVFGLDRSTGKFRAVLFPTKKVLEAIEQAAALPANQGLNRSEVSRTVQDGFEAYRFAAANYPGVLPTRDLSTLEAFVEESKALEPPPIVALGELKYSRIISVRNFFELNTARYSISHLRSEMFGSGVGGQSSLAQLRVIEYAYRTGPGITLRYFFWRTIPQEVAQARRAGRQQRFVDMLHSDLKAVTEDPRTLDEASYLANLPAGIVVSPSLHAATREYVAREAAERKRQEAEYAKQVQEFWKWWARDRGAATRGKGKGHYSCPFDRSLSGDQCYPVTSSASCGAFDLMCNTAIAAEWIEGY